MLKDGRKEEPNFGDNLGTWRRQGKEEEKKDKQEQKQRLQKAMGK